MSTIVHQTGKGKLDDSCEYEDIQVFVNGHPIPREHWKNHCVALNDIELARKGSISAWFANGSVEVHLKYLIP
jgi:hypothetical protein